jgi:hypothetical protein
MNRRQLIKQIALLTGTAVVGGDLLLSGCKSTDKTSAGFFTEKDIAFFDEVAETIIPKTDTPGAKEAAVGQFIASYAKDCYDEKQLQALKEGINTLNEASEKMNGHSFMDCTAEQKQSLLIEKDKEAKKYNEEKKGSSQTDKPPHYFTLMKQLTLYGFFTSKPGATKILRYVPVPGKYEGCIEYNAGDTAWA